MSKLKCKGAYWTPDIVNGNYEDSISNAGPSAWHKDLSCPIVAHAAVQQMVHGVPIDQTIYGCIDPFAFCLRAKVTGSDQLWLGDERQQRVTRFHVAREGRTLVKVSPPVKGKRLGAFKKASGVSDAAYNALPDDVWNEKVHTKNKSRYEERRTNIINGRFVAECNHISRFDWLNLNYEYYISESRKLLIP